MSASRFRRRRDPSYREAVSYAEDLQRLAREKGSTRTASNAWADVAEAWEVAADALEQAGKLAQADEARARVNQLFTALARSRAPLRLTPAEAQAQAAARIRRGDEKMAAAMADLHSGRRRSALRWAADALEEFRLGGDDRSAREVERFIKSKGAHVDWWTDNVVYADYYAHLSGQD